MSELFLPTKPTPPQTRNPRILLMYGKPKVGKTELLAQLPDSLMFDLEKGSAYVEALKMEINTVDDLSKALSLVNKAGRPYKRGILDTATALEEMCVSLAERIYASTSQGKNWFAKDAAGNYLPESGKMKYGTILDMPDGQGYRWLREAFFKVIDAFCASFEEVVIVAHVKDIILEKSSTNVSSLDLDLTGKIKRMLASKCDAIGYLARKGNQNILSFKTNDEIACGARAQHLSNQDIVVSEKDKDTGVLTTYWDRIFLPAPSLAE